MPTNTSSIGHIATDPLRNFKFTVSFADMAGVKFTHIGFMAISGLAVANEMIPYREGGMNTTPQKLPGQSDFTPITMTRGLVLGAGHPVWDWQKRLFAVMQGKGTGDTNDDFRTTMDIQVKDHPVTNSSIEATPTKAIFRIYNAWPASISFSDLDAGANAIVLEQMTLNHEGFEVLIASANGSGKPGTNLTSGDLPSY